MGDYRISLFINCCMLENTTMRIPENFTCITSSQSLVSYKCSQPHSQGSGNEVDMPSKRQAAKLTALFRSCSVLILRNLTNIWKTRYSVIRAGLSNWTGCRKEDKFVGSWALLYFGTLTHAPGGCNQSRLCNLLAPFSHWKLFDLHISP